MSATLSLPAILAGILSVAGGILVAALVIELLAGLMTVSLLDPPREDTIGALASAADALWEKFLKQIEAERPSGSAAHYWLPAFRVLRETDGRVFSALMSHLPSYQRRRVNAYLQATGILELLREVQAGTSTALIAKALKKANKAVSNSLDHLSWFGRKTTKWIKSTVDTKADFLENFIEGQADEKTTASQGGR